MTREIRDEPDFPPPPYEALHARLLAEAEALESAGHGAHAQALRAAVEAWWSAQNEWNERVAETLAVHHEINNALVGVRGNAQLMLMGPLAQDASVRDRLEVVLRESGRIQSAAARLRPIRQRLSGRGPVSRAA